MLAYPTRLVAFFIPVFILTCLSPISSQAEELDRSVQVAETKLRFQPQYWARGVRDLKYGDRVTLIRDMGAWSEVSSSDGERGFLPSGAVTERKVVLTTVAAPLKVRADESDVVLAGKGFSEGLEQALAAADATFNFVAVDAAESRSIDDTRLFRFVRDGGLVEELR